MHKCLRALIKIGATNSNLIKSQIRLDDLANIYYLSVLAL